MRVTVALASAAPGVIGRGKGPLPLRLFDPEPFSVHVSGT